VLEAFSEEKGDAHCPVIGPTNPEMLFQFKSYCRGISCSVGTVYSNAWKFHMFREN